MASSPGEMVVSLQAYLCFLLVGLVLHFGVCEADAPIVDHETMVSIKLTVETGIVVNLIDEDVFLCVTLDWWQPERCNSRGCSWGNAGLMNLDLHNPVLTRAIQELSPITVRAGGTLENRLVYDIGEHLPSEPCLPFESNLTALYNFTGGCMSMQLWDDLNAFWKRAGVTSLVFGISNLYGRSKERWKFQSSGPWITTNAYNLIKYTVEKGYPIAGWELGNELMGYAIEKQITAHDYAEDAKKLSDIVDELYPPPLKRPLLIAPDLIFFPNFTQLPIFLRDGGGDVVDVITRHSYSLGPGSDNVLQFIQNILSPELAADEIGLFRAMNDALAGHPGIVPWIGESGGAFRDGVKGVTDAYIMGFWYLDQLGTAAVLKNQAFCRQSLVGGNYGILDTDSFVPNPDYYGALLWRKLMGKAVFPVATKGTQDVRAYAHCQRQKTRGVTVLILNFSNTTIYNVEVEFGEFSGVSNKGVREEYHMSPHNGNITSKVVMLNGHPLDLSLTSKISEFVVTADSSSPLSINPLTYAFVVFKDIDVPDCSDTEVSHSTV